MIDGKPRIGDEVYIHGYIDEIRNDVVIIRNEGGYFGTSDREIFYYEEDERGYGTMNEADRKTEPQRNMAEDIVESFGFKAESYRQAKAKTEPTGYNLLPVDKDINVRSNSSEKPNNCEYAENPSGDAWECGCFPDTYCEHQIYDRNPDGTINIVECGYEPKTEPQIDDFFREPTAEERKAVAEYIKSISIPTGVNIFDLMDEPTISKMEQVDKDINVPNKSEVTNGW